MRRRRDLHSRHLVLRAVGRPVAVFRGHHIGARFGVVEGRIDNAGLHTCGNFCAQCDVALAARNMLVPTFTVAGKPSI